VALVVRETTQCGEMRGDLHLIDGSLLHFREYVRQRRDLPAERYTYVYHYQNPDGTLIFRYDNTAHFPTLGNFPHHKHQGAESSVISSGALDLVSVLAEIESSIRID
ncbi:MAG: DUF6516 family protein, partial [Chloroflexi bacterium]|nr:DUF6516 family protein [Chloroflexota bacterium]